GCSGATVAPGATCAVDVSFAPSSTGLKTVSLSIPTNAPSSPDLVPMNGRGIQAAATLEPPNLVFGNQLVGSPGPAQTGTVRNSGTPSSSQQVSVTNSGNGSLIIGAVDFTGTNPSEFTKFFDSCSGGTLAPAAGCIVSVAFAPMSAGPKSAVLSIPTNAPTTP